MLIIRYSIFTLILSLNIIKSTAITYTVDVKRYSSFPIISKTLGAQKDYFASAALYTDENGNIGAILEGIDADKKTSECYHTTITFKNGIPVATQPSNKPVFNLSELMIHPSITKYNELYYVLFNANETNLNVAITSNPKNPNEWIDVGIITPNGSDARYGAPLFATPENGLQQSYLFWSDWNQIYYANLQSVWINRDNFLASAYSFDYVAVLPGNPPLQLKTGDFFHVYNAFSSSSKKWSLGYVISDKTNPYSVTQRSTAAILLPTLDWEIGNATNFLGPNSLYLTGLLHDKINCPEENDWTQCFFGLYSGAATSIGAIKIIVSWQ